jgi:hypothetical protein
MINIDLEKIDFNKTVKLEIEGWFPIEVEYILKVYSGISILYWRVVNTDHTFQIQYQIVLQQHGGKLQEHFELVLKIFREDYKKWESQNFSEDWMQKYQSDFQDLIK